MKKTFSLLFLGLLAFCEKAQGELELTQVLERVNSAHPLLQAAKQERPSADAELLSSEGAFDVLWKMENMDRPVGYYDNKRYSTTFEQPTKLWGAKVYGGYSVTDGKFPVYEGKQETTDGGEAKVGIDVPLLRDGPIDRRRATIERANIGRNIADANIEQRTIELSRAATNAYFEWVAAGLRKGIYQELLNYATGRTSQLEKRMKAGDIPQFDLVDNQRTELQRRAQVVAAERLLQQTALELSLYYRDEQGQPRVPNENDIPRKMPRPEGAALPRLEENVSRALGKRPELKRVGHQKKQNDIEVLLQDNQLKPRVDLQFAASKDMGNGKQEKRDAEVEVGVRLEIPLQTRVADGKRAQALAKASELNLLETFAKDRIRTEVRDALIAIEKSRERVRLATAEADAARKLEAGERQRFSMGDSNLIFVNLREQTAAEAGVREIDALLDYQKAQAAYSAALAEVPGSSRN